jgi:metal-responsive CopG/Arc/MetJ family transcriptional regulator
MSDKQPPKKRKSRDRDIVRINLTISKALLRRVDEAAKQDYTTRSDIIRVALLWYLRPQGRELDQTDPDTVLKVLNQRRAKAALNKIIKENDIDPHDD